MLVGVEKREAVRKSGRARKIRRWRKKSKRAWCFGFWIVKVGRQKMEMGHLI